MERKKTEIEAKFPLLNKDSAINVLNDLANKVETNNIQKDIYYTPAHEDFLKSSPISEWFRIRITNTEKTINYKNWRNKNSNNKITCKEIEIGIDDSDGMIEMLKALDFKEIITVEKNRNSWNYNGVIISIDQINSLGDFIELEFKTNIFEKEKDSQAFLSDLIKELGLEVGDQIFAGYPQLLMKKKRTILNII